MSEDNNPYIVAGNALEGTSCGDYDVAEAIVDALRDAGFIQSDHRIIAARKALDKETE